MKTLSAVLSIARNQRGGVIIFVAVAMVVLIGCAALAIDLTHLYVARNELQNSADAGALAGARFLFVNDGTYDATSAINASGFVSVETGEAIPSANQMAYNGATANMSEKVPVDVNWVVGQNIGSDVERGHWSFGLGNLAPGFYPSDSTAMVNLNLVSPRELDENPNFINAVRVRTRREATPIASWFARIFGHDSFQLSADAVAYLGYSGKLEPLDSDQPIAICKQAVVNDNSEYDCNVGRMLNSGSDPTTHNTAGWTNFSQPCSTANASEMRSLICNPDGANLHDVSYGESIGAVGGVQYSVLSDLIKCWISQTDTDGDCIPDKVWNMTLPVIDCPGNNVSNCADLVGVVNVNFVWLLGNVGEWVNKVPDPYIPEADAPVAVCETTVTVINPDTGLPETTTVWEECTTSNMDPDCGNVLPVVPNYMSYEDVDGNSVVWSDSSPDATVRWANLVSNYNLQDATGNPPHYNIKTMYFFPDCKYHEPTGNTGGEFFGVLAKIPVLVE
jgi:hypothetical protein